MKHTYYIMKDKESQTYSVYSTIAPIQQYAYNPCVCYDEFDTLEELKHECEFLKEIGYIEK